MNKAAKLVSESILGNDFKTIVMGGRAYQVKAPTIATICKAITYLSCITDVNKGLSIDNLKKDFENMLRGVSVFVSGDPDRWEEFSECTPAELSEAMKTIMSLISSKDFFVCAALAANAAQMAAKQK